MMNQDEKQILFLKRKVDREKIARTEAERLLEFKSLELYQVNQQLLITNKNLDQTVEERTSELKIAHSAAELAAVHLKESLERLELIVQASGATTWEYNLTTNTFSCSETIVNQLAYHPEEITTYDEFISIIHSDDKPAVVNAYKALLNSLKTIDLQCRLLHKNGIYHWFHIVAQVDEGALRIVGSFVDIHERKESEKIIKKMAHYDALTNIPNRSFFNDFIIESIKSSKINNHTFALLLIDLNDFKLINDRYGHQSGDALLVNISTIIAEHIKGVDIVARMGGDEFALVLNELSPVGSLDHFCKTLITSCSKPIEVLGQQFSASLSIGIAKYPNDAETVTSLLNCADIAMYSAKRNKVTGSTFAYYCRDLDDEQSKKLTLRSKIEDAIENNHFHLEFQPCIEVSTGKCNSSEALLRWNNKPEGSTIQEVIEVSEESGLILKLSEIIISQACCFVAKLEKNGIVQKVGVNLSSVQFQYQDIVAIFTVAINKFKISAHHLQVEVTENLFLGDMERAISVLTELRTLGIDIYIDDFGTGYSSLKYLQILPVDWVKIDKIFIDDLAIKDQSLHIIQAIIQMTHSMKRKVVAEGVETAEQYQLLHQLGCDVAQGYYISPALPVKGYIKWLSSNQPFIGRT
ncbi:putative bifunctional diguanylate cyclase/phosphodiesterase [Candidatus Colwellia aromaticivorans]|uniref:putative bifunctional diguanylate cyclase/phosphodiesterase n=1 Tax=Candidatus Colwellia aromaticivorans TaxID=2267621 RepID=UPI000DF2F255|nr:GGDEF domain-containing phosphodiesterase [Candidatus Colwellia aromaticivorans]